MKTRFVIYILILFSNIAIAQWEYSGIEIVPTSWPTWEFDTDIDISGGLILVWEDNREINNPDVYVQKVDTAGFIQWQEYGVNGAVSDADQYGPYVVSDNLGGAYVAWSDLGRNGGNYDIYAQHFDNFGNRTWDDGGLNIIFRSGHQILDHMISDGQSGAIICWSDDYWAYTDTLPVTIQRIDLLGNLLFGIDGIRSTTLQEGEQRYSQLIMTSDSAFVVVWEDSRLFGQGPGIYAQKIDLNGNILWDSAGVPVAVDTVDIDGDNIRISPGPSGGFYTIWRNHLGPRQGISMQWNDNSGQAKWGASGYAISIGPQHGDANIITNFDGRAIITWILADHIPFKCYLNVIDTAGVLNWSNHKLVGFNINSIFGIAQSIQGEFEIGLNRSDLDCEERILKFDMEGNYIWGDSGVCLICPNCPSYTPKISPDGIGGAYLSWKRNDNIAVRLNRVYPDGWVAPDTTTGIDNDLFIPGDFSISSHPNPFNRRTQINLQLSSLDPLEISLYDILGRKLTSLYDGVPDEYNLEFIIDLSSDNYSSGVYFITAEQGGLRKIIKSTLLK